MIYHYIHNRIECIRHLDKLYQLAINISDDWKYGVDSNKNDGVNNHIKRIELATFNLEFKAFRKRFKKCLFFNSSTHVYDTLIKQYDTPIKQYHTDSFSIYNLITNDMEFTIKDIKSFSLIKFKEKDGIQYSCYDCIVYMCGTHPYPFMRIRLGESSHLSLWKNPTLYAPYILAIALFCIGKLVEN